MSEGARGRVVRPCLARLLALCLVAWAVAVSPAWAEEKSADVRAVVDVSGSMKAHDPDRLAESAMGLLVSLLPESASAGVWTFGERVDNPLPLGRVEADWRQRALSLPPSSRDQQYTDIETALRRAIDAEANGRQQLILMTDGVIDLPPARGNKPAVDRASRERIVDELAPELADRGATVHAIAFSDEADLALVERLAQRTGGLAARVDSPEGLMGAFLDIFERIFPADRLPLDDDGGFTVDEGVDRLSALVFHDPEAEPLTLVGPDGTRYRADSAPDGANWQVEPRFDLIRVPDPEAGQWRLEGPVGEGSRISISGPWQLHTATLPATLYRGFPVPVEAWLVAQSEERPLPGNLTLEVSLEDADGEVQSSVTLDADDQGRFRGELPAPALTGNAQLVVRASGDGFTRQRRQAVNVLPAIGALHDPAEGRVVLAAEHPRLNRDNTEIGGELGGETLEAEPVGETRWTLALPELDPDLRQPLTLTARVTLDGETRELRLPRLMLNPDARVGIAGAGAGPTLAAERFADADEAAATEAEPSLADRFVEGVNAVPAKLRLVWQEGWPGLVERARGWTDSPMFWILLMLVIGLTLLRLLWRHTSRSRSHERRDPYV
ncbi:vWA domain-containing protein [Halomonas getboli]|uniref:vWA domain-containing protein n=1 Tax=Halomonas getboli TaxID=2935862 RepID=UPI001FFF9CF9|nr:vWA domain-containing protein [Halomonas getboli]MCK2183582.1 VWA domain-containing protein [Halomonas getboli]